MIEIIKSENVMNFADVLDEANGVFAATRTFRATLVNLAPPIVKFSPEKF